MAKFSVRVLRVSGERVAEVEAKNRAEACRLALAAPGIYGEPQHRSIAIIDGEVLDGRETIGHGA